MSTEYLRALAFVFVILAAGVCAPGCGKRQPEGPIVLRIGIGIPSQASATGGARAVITFLRSEPWLTAKPDGRQSERIATSWTWDASGTILHLKLRQDVYFHDGTKLTPILAAASLRESAANAANEAALSFASIKSVSPSGDDSVEVKLAEPNAFVVPDLSLVFVRLPGHPEIGTGPFRLVKQDDQGAVLGAFPRYYRGRPAIDQINVTTYPTQRKAWAALMRGDIDMLHEVSRDAVEFVEAETTVKSYSFPRPYYIPLVFNVRHSTLRNPEVRKAINEALDRATLIRDGLSGRGRPADGPISPEHWAYSAPVGTFAFDPAAARERLERAGLKIRDHGDGSMPARFSFTCLVLEDARFERLAVLVQKELADIGIEMKLVPLKQPDMEARLKSGEFDAFLFELFGRSLSWVYEFWHSHDLAHFNNGYRGADAVLDRIRAARSDDETRAGVADLSRVLHDDPPAAFIAWQSTSRAVSTNFDVAADDKRDIMTNVWQWHLVKEPRPRR